MKKTISLDEEVRQKFQSHCEKNGYCFSKRLVMLMNKDMRVETAKEELVEKPKFKNAAEEIVYLTMKAKARPLRFAEIVYYSCLTLGDWGVAKLTDDSVKKAIDALYFRGEIFRPTQTTYKVVAP